MGRARLVLGVAVLLLAGFAAGASEVQAPPWKLSDLTGQARRLEEWRGRWVLLKFGTTQCPSCAAELEELARVEARLRELDLEVLDIYLGEGRDPIRRYWKKKAFAYRPTILYEWEKTGTRELIRAYGFSLLPHLVLVDPAGQVAWKGGYTPAEELMVVLEARITTPGARAD